MKLLTSTTAALLIASTLGAAAARPGEERTIEGTLVWPEAVTPEATTGGERRILVHDDHGNRHVIFLTTTTEIPAPLQAGQRVTVRGQEGFDPGHLVAARVAAPGDQSAEQSGDDAQAEGAVLQVSGDTLVLKTTDARQVAVDLSAIGLSVRRLLQPGREVRVFGTLDDQERLIASGLQLDYVPAALPGAPAP
jgi:hypothetical protein